MTEGRATLAWDGRQEGEEGGILTRQRYIRYRDFDGFMDIYIYIYIFIRTPARVLGGTKQPQN